MKLKSNLKIENPSSDFLFLLENSNDFIYVINKEHRFTACSQSFAQIIGLKNRQKIQGKTIFDVFPKDIANQYYQIEEKILLTGQAVTNHTEPYYDCQDNLRWLSSTKKPTFDSKGNISGLISISHSISRKNNETFDIKNLKEESLLLTGLPNRKRLHRLCTQKIQTVAQTRRKLAIVLININQFHYINTIYGYDIGDQILFKLKAELLERLPNDCVFSRIESDKFFVLYPFDQDKPIQKIIDKTTAIFKDPIHIEKEKIELSFRAGISVYPDYGNSTDQLINAAELSIYRAKELNEKVIVFSEDIENNLYRKRFIAQQMKQSLDQNEFYIVYQPIFELASKKIIAFESLIRWNSSVIGEIYPDEFISIAESTGFIVQLGQWIRNQAIEEFAEIKKLPSFIHSSLYLTLNISALELSQKNLQTDLLRSINQYKLDPRDIMIEMTERVILDDVPNIDDILNQLFDSDIHLIIDDFGSKYSTLSYLVQYPFSTLKMDRSFVSKLQSNAKAMTIFRSVIKLSKEININLIAEGVETEEQSQFLQSIGCAYGQGYHLGRPSTLDIIKNTYL